MMTTAKLARARSMWADGAPIAEIAQAVGMTERAMRAYASRRRDLFPERKHGADWWLEHLAGRDGESAADIAAELGASPESVWSWRRRLGGIDGG